MSLPISPTLICARSPLAGTGQYPTISKSSSCNGPSPKVWDAGAVGLSTGLDYISECFATTDELVEVCAPMAAAQGLYVTHVRYKKGTLAGVMEAVEIGRRAKVPVHISHFKASTPEETDTLLNYVDKTAVNEVDFSFDVYPYLPGSTMLNFMPALRYLGRTAP